MAELEQESRGDFLGFMRIEPAMFQEILMRITLRLTKAYIKWRKALEPGLKLALTLHYLATGNSKHDLAFAFLVPHNTISIFLTEFCQAIVREYADEVVKMLSDEEEWHVSSTSSTPDGASPTPSSH